MRSYKFAMQIAGAVCLLGASLTAQITTGTISGTVVDSTGGAIPGASVAILHEDTGVTRTVQTDAAGHYTAPQLSVGKYRLTASREGFQTQVRSGIELTIGREAVANFEFAVGAVSQTVEVTGEAPLVQTTESTMSYLVGDQTIRDLPLNGRDVSQLILLNPAVIENHNGKWGAPDKGYGLRFSISGMRGEDNAFLLDGSYINDFYRHLPASPTGALTGVETVREFQMLTASFSAAYGRALGGVFNAVSKSGTNGWHGDAYEFLRNSDLDARNFYDVGSGPPPFRRNQFGATAGGPIRRDKIFFFTAYEGLRQSLGQTGIANVPDLNARKGILANGTAVGVSSLIAPFLKLFPLPNGRAFGDGTAQFIFSVGQPAREDFGQGRADYQLSDKDSLFARFTGSNSSTQVYNRFPDRFTVSLMATRLLTLSETHVVSPRLLNGFRFAFSRINPGKSQIIPPGGPEVISVPGQDPAGIDGAGFGLTQLAGLDAPGEFIITNRFDLNDDVNLILGNHSLQFGGMLERMQFNTSEPNRPFGDWRFPDLQSLLQARPDRFRGTPPQFGNLERGVRQWFLALYLQDDWRVTPSLTLNLGLRWEPYTVPTEVNGLLETQRNLTDSAPTKGNPYWQNKSWTNFSPRAGFAWSPFKDGKTSVRGGFGLYYVPIDPAIYIIPIIQELDFSPFFQFNNPVGFPNALTSIATALATPGSQNISSVTYNNFKSPHALQYSLNVQRQIGASNVLTVGYSGRRGLDLSSLANFNAPHLVFDGISLALPPGPVILPNPNYQTMNIVGDNTSSWYNGLTVALQRRFSAGFQAQISYTFSKAMSEADGNDTGNHVSAGSRGILSAYNVGAAKALSGYDIRNVFIGNYSYDLPFGKSASGWSSRLLSGWQLTGILGLQNGQPATLNAASPSALSAYFGEALPNLNPGFKVSQVVHGGPDQYYSLKAFSPPGPRELGNLGQSALIGPGLVQWDMGLTKNTALTERLHLQFRGEIFNLLNHANFAAPGQVGTSGTAGEIFTKGGAPIQNATVITQTVTTSRQIQFGLKLIF